MRSGKKQTRSETDQEFRTMQLRHRNCPFVRVVRSLLPCPDHFVFAFFPLASFSRWSRMASMISAFFVLPAIVISA